MPGGGPASALPANSRRIRTGRRRRNPMDAAILATPAAAPKQTRQAAGRRRSAGRRARDEAARAAIGAERVLAHEADRLRLRAGTIRRGGVDPELARRARV